MSFCKFCEFFTQQGTLADDPGWCEINAEIVNGSDDARPCPHFDHITAAEDILLGAEGYITSPAGHQYSVIGCKTILKIIREFDFVGKTMRMMRVEPRRFGSAFQSVSAAAKKRGKEREKRRRAAQ